MPADRSQGRIALERREWCGDGPDLLVDPILHREPRRHVGREMREHLGLEQQHQTTPLGYEVGSLSSVQSKVLARPAHHVSESRQLARESLPILNRQRVEAATEALAHANQALEQFPSFAHIDHPPHEIGRHASAVTGVLRDHDDSEVRQGRRPKTAQVLAVPPAELRAGPRRAPPL